MRQAGRKAGRQGEREEFLQKLGASKIIDRNELDQPAKPLEAALWDGVVDTTGGQIFSQGFITNKTKRNRCCVRISEQF